MISQIWADEWKSLENWPLQPLCRFYVYYSGKISIILYNFIFLDNKMPQFEVTVKWGKEKFPKVGINTDENPEVFRAQLFALTKWGQI